MDITLFLLMLSVFSDFQLEKQIENEIYKFDSSFGVIMENMSWSFWNQLISGQQHPAPDLDDHWRDQFLAKYLAWAKWRDETVCQSQELSKRFVLNCNYIEAVLDTFNTKKIDLNQMNRWINVSTKISVTYRGMVYSGEGMVDQLLKQIDNLSDIQFIWLQWKNQLQTLSPVFASLIQQFAPDLKNFWNRFHNGLGGLDESEEILPQTYCHWNQVKPFYNLLIDYIITQLSKHYPKEMFSNGTIPLPLLRTITGTQMDSIFDMVRPFKEYGPFDGEQETENLKEKAQQEYVDLGFDPLPESFWTDSNFNSTGCHPITLNFMKNGPRMRICMDSYADRLFEILLHELGHVYYYKSYSNVGFNLYKMKVNHVVHESIGETVRLFYQGCKSRNQANTNYPTMINMLMKEALSSFVRIPYGLSLETWLYQIMNEQITDPYQINQRYWMIRERIGRIGPDQYQQFNKSIDPLSKYHVRQFMSYMRYVYATIFTHQLHKAICNQNDEDDTETFYCCPDMKQMEYFRNFLKHGASDVNKWASAYQMLTNETEIHYNTEPLLRYYQPLIEWLQYEKTKN